MMSYNELLTKMNIPIINQTNICFCLTSKTIPKLQLFETYIYLYDNHYNYELL